MKSALILGLTGPDGACLTAPLLADGSTVGEVARRLAARISWP